MKTSRTNNGSGQEYMVMFKLYVKPTGDMALVIGNQRMEVTADEVHSLLCGTLEFANVFSKLHQQVDVTTMAIMNENNTVVQPSVQTSTGVNGN